MTPMTVAAVSRDSTIHWNATSYTAVRLMSATTHATPPASSRMGRPLTNVPMSALSAVKHSTCVGAGRGGEGVRQAIHM